MTNERDVIWLEATDREGDLACDFTIATDIARDGIRESLARDIVGAPRDIAGGVEVQFRPGAWDAVRRYIELESRCCAFLTLSAERTEHAVTLRVTGRPEARDVIRAIFSHPESEEGASA